MFKFKTRDGKTPKRPTEDAQHNRESNPSDANKNGTPKFPHPMTKIEAVKADIERTFWK